MTNAYYTLKRKHEREFKEFPMIFAFSTKDLEEGLVKLGLTPDDKDKIYSTGGGGYYRKSDSPALKEMLDRFDREMQEAKDADETGDGFLFEMFDYELANHEYCITYDVHDTLDALDMTIEEVQSSEKLTHALNRARKAQFAEVNG
jgi:hypothetical protein